MNGAPTHNHRLSSFLRLCFQSLQVRIQCIKKATSSAPEIEAQKNNAIKMTYTRMCRIIYDQ